MRINWLSWLKKLAPQRKRKKIHGSSYPMR